MRRTHCVVALLVAATLALAAGPAPGAELRVDGQREFGTEVELAWTPMTAWRIRRYDNKEESDA